MAKDTNTRLRNTIFYQVFVRQHARSQDFAGVIADLERIKALGVDVIYLLPIHPIGRKARKGSVGSPYAIRAYDRIDPSLGTMDDFKRLVEKAHALGLMVMMDIVINHTARDSDLVEEHPDWFYKDKNGHFANRVGDWSDVTDLDYNKRPVWDYFLDVLFEWAKLVDGFRCDVAPLIPLDFWREARQRIGTIKPDFIWLSESVHLSFVKYLRDLGYECASDSEMYQVFDILYDYDIFDFMTESLQSGDPTRWLEEIERQEAIYPKNYVKLRSFENHDQPRLRSRVKDDDQFVNMLALNFFIRGAPLIYAGMEHGIAHRPDLFNDDVIAWDPSHSFEPLIRRLSDIKKKDILREGSYHSRVSHGVVVIDYVLEHELLIGIFNLSGQQEIDLALKDGRYMNRLDERMITVNDGRASLSRGPVIIDTTKGRLR
ncbi:MAG: alpha-amylase family glycosyl hydrolase [Acholeplasmataceae bacterium]